MDQIEPVVIVPYNPYWQPLFEEEAARIRTHINPHRLAALEHYGSTAVPGLAAKPIIGILLGMHSLPLETREQEDLAKLGYSFDKELKGCFYWKKREPRPFTLAIVPYKSSIWYDLLLIRDYLIEHPDRAAEYAAVKYHALEDGFNTLTSYRKAKSKFLDELFMEAKQWKQQEKL